AGADGKNLRGPATIGKGIVRGDRIGRAGIDVEPQDGAEEGLRVLAIAELIAAAATVTHPDIEQAVRAEAEPAAIVVACGLRNLENRRCAGRIAAIRVFRRLIADDAGITGPVGVVDEEPSILGIVGMESQAEQPPLTAS